MFLGTNSKQLHYYVVPTLVVEKPEWSYNKYYDITYANYDNVNAADLDQRIFKTEKKRRSFGVNNIAISSILLGKNVSINKIIKKVNEETFSFCAPNSFYFICIDMTDDDDDELLLWYG